MDHRQVHAVEKALGWSGPSGLGTQCRACPFAIAPDLADSTRRRRRSSPHFAGPFSLIDVEPHRCR